MCMLRKWPRTACSGSTISRSALFAADGSEPKLLSWGGFFTRTGSHSHHLTARMPVSRVASSIRIERHLCCTVHKKRCRHRIDKAGGVKTQSSHVHVCIAKE